jgi:hypothetical protein
MSFMYYAGSDPPRTGSVRGMKRSTRKEALEGLRVAADRVWVKKG